MRRIFTIFDIVVQIIFIAMIIAVGYPLLSHKNYDRDILDGIIMMALGYVFLSSAVHTIRSWRSNTTASGLHKLFLFALLLFSGIVLGDDFSSAELNYAVIPVILFPALCIYDMKKRSVL